MMKPAFFFLTGSNELLIPAADRWRAWRAPSHSTGVAVGRTTRHGQSEGIHFVVRFCCLIVQASHLFLRRCCKLACLRDRWLTSSSTRS